MFREIFCSFLLILVTSCGTAPFFTKHGFFFKPSGHDVNQEEVELAIDLLQETFVSKRIYTKSQIDDAFMNPKYTVELKSANFLCATKDEPGRMCSGLHCSLSNRIFYVHEDRLYNTSLVHELIHMVKLRLDGDAGGKHMDFTIWSRACAIFEGNEEKKILCEMNSVEGLTNSLLRGVIENG